MYAEVTGSQSGSDKQSKVKLDNTPKTRNRARIEKVANILSGNLQSKSEVISENVIDNQLIKSPGSNSQKSLILNETVSDNSPSGKESSQTFSLGNSDVTPKKRGGIRKKKLDEGLAFGAIYLLENGDLTVSPEEEAKIRKIADQSLNDPESHTFLQEILSRNDSNIRKTRGQKSEQKIDFLTPRSTFF